MAKTIPAGEASKILDVSNPALCSIGRALGLEVTSLTQANIKTMRTYIAKQKAAGKTYVSYGKARENFIAARHKQFADTPVVVATKNIQKATSKKENTYDYTIVAEVLEIAPKAIYNTAVKLHMDPSKLTEKNVIALRTYIDSRKEQGRTYGKIRQQDRVPNVPEVPEVSVKRTGRPVGSKNKPASAKVIITVREGVSIELPISRDQIKVII
jgi:hypothetical protein